MTLRARVSIDEMQLIKQVCQTKSFTASNLLRQAVNEFLVRLN